MATPTDEDQQHLLQVVWDLCVTYSKWPTLAQVDRKLYRDSDVDVQEVSQRLPPTLLYPRLDGWPAPDQKLQLSIAGVSSCSGTQDEVRYFLEAVRYAAELERAWPADPARRRTNLF
jgi:hypothetical protein